MRLMLVPQRMDEREVHDIFYYLTEKKKPLRFSGKGQKNKYKAWKKKVSKVIVKKRDKRRKLTLGNSRFLVIKKTATKVLLREKDLNDIWTKFHVEKGHIGQFKKIRFHYNRQLKSEQCTEKYILLQVFEQCTM